MKSIRAQFISYLFAGLFAYSVDVGSFGILRYFLPLTIESANLLARIVGALTAYLLNYYWTFSAHTYATKASFLKYMLLWLVSTAISTSVLVIFAGAMELKGEIAVKGVVEVVLAMSNFLVCKYWIYKRVIAA